MRKTLLKKVTSLIAVTAVAALSVPSSFAGAAGNDCGVAMYLPMQVSEMTDLKTGWEGTDPIDPNTSDPEYYGNRVIKTADGKAWWGYYLQHDFQGNTGDVTGWAAPSYRYDADKQRVGVRIHGQVEGWPHILFHPKSPVVTADVDYMVIGAYANQEVNVRLFTGNEAGDNAHLQGGTWQADIKFEQGYHEYILPTANFDNWQAEASYESFRFYDVLEVCDIASELEFSYIRFGGAAFDGTLFDADYTGTRVENGAADYSVENNIVDFSFLNNLDLSTVTESSVQINSEPVEWVMTSEFAPASFRVNLGNLSMNRTYKITFDGIKFTDGTAVADEFTFSTPAVPDADPVTPQLKKADTSTGVVGGWESTDALKAGTQPQEKYENCAYKIEFEDGTWWGTSDNEWTSTKQRYNSDNGTVGVYFSTSGGQWPKMCVQFGEIIDTTKANKMVAGIKSDQNIALDMYYGVDGDEDEVRKIVVNLKRGYHEYVIDLNAASDGNWNAAGSANRFRFLGSGDLGGDNQHTFELEFAYVRFVDDTYKAIGSGTGYDSVDNTIDVVLPCDIDIDSADAAKIKLNGQAADYIMVNSDVTNGFRAHFDELNPLTRYYLEIDGLRNAEGANLPVNICHFTTAAGEAAVPVTSWNLVENYGTDSEKPISSDTAIGGKTITAVTPGIYNNTGAANNYMLVLAGYKNGNLVKCAVETAEAAAGAATAEKAVTIAVPSDADSLKAFIWDRTELTPICRTITNTNSMLNDPIKVLILGNSITYHKAMGKYAYDWWEGASLDWEGHWGMAATSRDKDYVHQLMSAVNSEYINVEFMYQNISAIEGLSSFDDESINKTINADPEIRDCVTYDADIIIMTIGANIHSNTFGAAEYQNIINKFKTNPDAKVIVGVTPLTPHLDNGNEVNIMKLLETYAADNNLPFVNMFLDSWMEDGEIKGQTEYFPPNGTYTNAGVMLHPYDPGMEYMANLLAPVLKDTMNKCYN